MESRGKEDNAMIGRRGTALVLGGSSGLGLATARKLATAGYDLFIVHRDRKSDIPQIERDFQEITERGSRLASLNIDALQPERRLEALERIKGFVGQLGRITVVVHSIAKGSLKPMWSKDGHWLEHQDLQITLNAMAFSLYDWSRELLKSGLFASDVRIVAFTSEGNSKAWPGYGAVSAAKVAMEALVRNMALEYAPLGIKVNCIQAGVTETRAFQMIPGHEQIKATALKRNPNGRLTLPEDVANAVYLLTLPEAAWITGTIIKVDGGESLR